MTYVAILIALCLSGISSYLSVMGMAAIFPGSFWTIVALAGTMEAAKVVAVVWVHQHWQSISRLIRGYLVSAIIILMLITSMGVFGFLSKAHIEHQLKIDSSIGVNLAITDQALKTKLAEAKRIEDEITRLDTPVEKLTDLSAKASDARTAIRATKDNEKPRKKLNEDLTKIQGEIAQLEAERIKQSSAKDVAEAEAGPIKYLANLYYGEATKDQLDHTVRIAILVLVMVIDPLAIFLLLGVSTVYKNNRRTNVAAIIGQQAKRPYLRKKKNSIEISKDDLTKF
jgi:hypothetical protein